ncbi:uncharacterized protein LOC124892016 [Capsicum annuum]|uniref:uncharacterized protein LOC124892016 n=1 Tax=Capsicum annuum TaxID=4072 RepID=UPI001FB0BFC8|nr:uncharacterized protein LOC124892016 [Capsicum annuum]
MEGDLFKYKGNITKIVHPYLTPTVREMKQRYMENFKTYTKEVKDTSIDALKAKLKGVTVLTSSAEVADEDKDLGGHHYVPSPPHPFNHAGSSGLKISPDASNDDDLRERVALLEKIVLTDMAAADEKSKKEKKEEETEEENAIDEEEEEEEEEEKEKMRR